jgi:hypothetical protein
MLKSIGVLFIVAILPFERTLAQDHGFPFGTTVTLNDLLKAKYEIDSTANAIVLNEFGEAYFNNDGSRLLVEIHRKIKILKPNGVENGNFKILLRKGTSVREELEDLEGATFLISNGAIRSFQLDKKSIFREPNTNYEWVRFTLPNVQVGSVIEVKYLLSTPFLLNYWPWEFQSDIPKLYSEFCAHISANYVYNISIRGFLKLDKNDHELRSSPVLDVDVLKLGIKNIPAFREEQFMTAKSNFLSAVHFELAEIRHFNGTKDKISKEWKDVAQELFDHENFGTQIKRARNLFEDKLSFMTGGATTPLDKAKKIYAWIQSRYEWNEYWGKYTDKGVRYAYENKKGNVGDINLSLLGALQAAEFTANPVILSTRENGMTTTLYPVLSEFNYVIVQLQIGEESFLLDATDPIMPFGMLPEHCLNGNGRLLTKKEATEVNLMPKTKSRTVSNLSLKLNAAGELTGALQIKYYGYHAVNKRKQINSFAQTASYTKGVSDRWKVREIRQHKIEGLNDLEGALTEEMEIDFNSHDASSAERIYFNPFIIGQWSSNPFVASERKYPVDFGVAQEEIILLNLEYPADYKLDEIPKNMALAMPDKGGMFKFNFNNIGNKLNIYYSLNLTKPVYDSSEYFSLKDLFERMLQLKQTDLVFIKL